MSHTHTNKNHKQRVHSHRFFVTRPYTQKVLKISKLRVLTFKLAQPVVIKADIISVGLYEPANNCS